MTTPRRVAFVAGLLAAGAAVLVLSVGRLVMGPPGVLDAVADGVTLYLPLTVFEALLQSLGPLAKGLAFAAVAGGAVVTGGLAGILFARLGGVGLREVTLVSAAAWALVEFVLLPVVGAGFLGSSLAGDPLALQAPLLVAVVAYGAMFAGLRGALDPSLAGDLPAERIDADAGGESGLFGRRRFMRGGLTLVGVGALVAAGGSVLLQVLAGARHPAGGRPGPALTEYGPTPALTPVPDFYRIDKNLVPPTVDGAAWRLTVDGSVERTMVYSLADLRSKPRHEAYRTLECISYQVVPGDDLISNQRWGGVRMADLLDEAGVRPEARFVLFEAVDGYTESLPLEVARHPDTWVADEMGPPGTPLEPAHGYPARVLIAGRFGMKQPKWLTRITLAAADVDGYWEQRGWDKDAVVVTMSRIDWPRPNEEVAVGVPFRVYGIANSGDRGISRVEVSSDDGETWVDAEVEPIANPLGPLTWVRWRVELTAAAPGVVRLVARATDGRGNVQDGTPRSPLPAGATGWHRVRLVAVA
jgi:DMSO/TMAO reductase YedYZ molybdopterin-dependent catalytic subunit